VGGEKVNVEYSPPSNLFKRTPLNVVFLFSQVSSRAHRVVIPVYNKAGNVIETHEHAGEFKE
jgi:hypothetical protein